MLSLIHEADGLQGVVNRLRIRSLYDPEIDRLRRELEGMNARWFRVCTELVGQDQPHPMFDDVEGMIEIIRGLRWRDRMCYKLAALVNKLSEKLNAQRPHPQVKMVEQQITQMNEAADILRLFISEWRGDDGPNRSAIVFDPHF